MKTFFDPKSIDRLNKDKLSKKDIAKIRECSNNTIGKKKKLFLDRKKLKIYMFPNLGSQYKFIKEIGSGGTGVVNLAIDNHSGYQVAIKTLFDFHKEDAEILNKFKIEANIYLLRTPKYRKP